MAGRRYGTDEKKIARFEAEGCGQGHGAEYKPWLTDPGHIAERFVEPYSRLHDRT